MIDLPVLEHPGTFVDLAGLRRQQRVLGPSPHCCGLRGEHDDGEIR